MKFNRRCSLNRTTEQLIQDLDFLDLSLEEEKTPKQEKKATKEEEEPNFLDF